MLGKMCPTSHPFTSGRARRPHPLSHPASSRLSVLPALFIPKSEPVLHSSLHSQILCGLTEVLEISGHQLSSQNIPFTFMP